MQLSVSKLLKYDDCPRQYLYQYVERLEPLAMSSTLAFGKAVHLGVTNYLIALAKGDTSVDPEKVFADEFQHATSVRETNYTTHSREALLQIGRVLTGSFPEYWDTTQLIVATDKDGEPIVERKFVMDIGQDVQVVMIPDIVAMNMSGQIGAFDAKTPATTSPEGFAVVSEQLATYRLGLAVHSGLLGIPQPSWVGFMEGIKKAIPKTKRGEGPHWEPIAQVPCNSTVGHHDIVSKFHETAKDIRQKRFNRRPRMAFNTPCALCDFRRLCYEGSSQGLRERPPFQQAA